MACGGDGICRSGSGTFDSSPVAVPAAPEQLDAADLDDDGKKDLIVAGQTNVAVHYFDEKTNPAAELDIPISPGPDPAIGELSGDSYPDIVVTYNGGITAALGNARRSLVSTVYPALQAPLSVLDARLITGNVVPDFGQSSLLLASVKNFSGSVLVHVTPRSLDVLGVSTEHIDKLAGNIAVGNLDEDAANSPCDDLLMPFKGADRLYEFSPCTTDASGNTVVDKKAAQAPILLPSGDRVIGPLALLDLDGDGHLDLLVGVASGSNHAIDVAYGVGDGTFNSATPVPASQGDNLAARAVDIGAKTPLAIGDLDGDGLPDYVDAHGVYVDRPNTKAHFATVATSDGEGWSEALIADLNHNGMPDVLTANAHQSGAVFLDGAGGGQLSRFDVPTDGPLSHLCTGDFDGDLLGDVGAVEEIDGGDQLAVLFGNAYGAPDRPQRMGLLNNVVQVASTPSMQSLYAARSITTVSRTDDGALTFAGFGGRGDRVMRATFIMVDPQQNASGPGGYFAPVHLATGSFDADSHGDLAELGISYPDLDQFRLWLTPMTGQAAIGLLDPRFTAPLPADVDWSRAEMAAGNLDGSGPDEVVLLAPRKAGSGSRGYIARAADSGDGHYVFKLGKPLPLSWGFEQEEGGFVPPGDSGGGRALVADVDGDGIEDVIALAPASKKSDSALVVFHGNGAPELGTPEVVPQPPHASTIAFTTLQTDRDPALELALLTGPSVYIADLGSDGRYHVASTPAIDLGAAHIHGAGLIAAGDFDGDGVEDIAVANASSAFVFRGVPENR